MMKKRALATAAVWLICVSSVLAEALTTRVESLVTEAVENNPKIAAAREKSAAFKERIPQAGALEDPMLGFSLVNLPGEFDFTEEDMTMKEASVIQKLPFPGKRDLNKRAAAKEAEAAAAEIEDTVNQVVRDVKSAFYDLSHAYRAEEVTQRNKGLLEAISEITRARYALGQGGQEDILRVRVEISAMVDDLLMLEQKKETQEARLKFLLNRPQDSRVQRPVEVAFRRTAFSIEHLQEQAMDDNPLLKILQRQIDARETEVEMAKRNYLPDFNLRFAYGQRENRQDLYTCMIELNIPIYYKSKQERSVSEAAADVRSARSSLRSAQNEIRYMIADLGTMVKRWERKVDLYRTGIIPQTRLQIDTALRAYRVEKADFMNLLDSGMRLYRYELDYHEALTEFEKSVAALEAVVGKALAREVEK